ncbi:uncharacterized protein LOC135805101 [Sycon ciliatum]|uniref:uncharacterized protein LOC135805101 n=1 Tax=Sycon ciliatum TaxID=27933 RepID=UPI0020A9DF25|eukprot:scpid41431/ scgid11772/ 
MMCLKISLLLRVLAVVCALLTVSLVAAGLSSVQKNGTGAKGCYYHHPTTAVCVYADAVSVLTIIVALFFILLDCCLSLKPKRGKRFKRLDMVTSVFMSVVWLSCGGTMAGFESALRNTEKDKFKNSTRSMANVTIVTTWISAVTWLLLTITVCCTDKEPQTDQGLLVEPSDEDDLARSTENKPLLSKS